VAIQLENKIVYCKDPYHCCNYTQFSFSSA